MDESKEKTTSLLRVKKPWQTLFIGLAFWLLAKIISEDYLTFAAAFELVGFILFLGGLITLIRNKFRKK